MRSNWWRIVPGILAVVLFCSSAAATDSISAYSYGEFTEGWAMTWRDAVVLSRPDASSDTLASLPRGSFIEVTGPPVDSLVWNGVGSSWYPVIDASEVQGFVAGTDLALGYLRLSPEATALLAVTAGSNSMPEFTGAVLALAEGGEVVDSIPVWLPPLMYEPEEYDPWAYCAGIGWADESGLDRAASAIVVSMWVEACGYVCTDQLFVWTGQRLVQGPTACSVVEAGLFHGTGSLILPSDSGGADNRVTVLTVSEEWNEELYSYVETDRSAQTWLWDGSAFAEE